MIIFVSIKKLVQTFWWLIAAVALYVFYQSIGLMMSFLLVIGLLALRFAPALVLPIILIAIGVHFTGGFSFIADMIVWGFWGLISLPFVLPWWKTVRLILSERSKENSKLKGVIFRDNTFFDVLNKKKFEKDCSTFIKYDVSSYGRGRECLFWMSTS